MSIWERWGRRREVSSYGDAACCRRRAMAVEGEKSRLCIVGGEDKRTMMVVVPGVSESWAGNEGFERERRAGLIYQAAEEQRSRVYSYTHWATISQLGAPNRSSLFTHGNYRGIMVHDARAG